MRTTGCSWRAVRSGHAGPTVLSTGGVFSCTGSCLRDRGARERVASVSPGHPGLGIESLFHKPRIQAQNALVLAEKPGLWDRL